jgi:XTP/dITP diphosphohydrolase
VAESGQHPLVELVAIFERLRRECAWKAAQTHESLTRYLIEESYEAVEAIESGDRDAIREELGDVLLQVYLHAAIAAQAGDFDIADVAAGLREKMIRRNPHVFGDAPGGDAASINEAWQQIKAVEKPDRALLDGVPQALPALLRADKLVDRAQRAGRPVSADPDSADIGERLLALVVRAHSAGIDPEQALSAAVRRRAEQP